MSVGTRWAIAADDAADAILLGDDDLPTLWLDGIGEIDLMALAELLGVPYEPTPVVEAADGGLVLRLPEAFLRAIAALPQDSRAATAAKWRTAAAGVAAQDIDHLAARLAEMSTFAQRALAGPGVVSVPLF